MYLSSYLVLVLHNCVRIQKKQGPEIFINYTCFLEYNNTGKFATLFLIFFFVESIIVGDAGRSWIEKAYQRAKEQAKEEGRDLEDVVVERWGVRMIENLFLLFIHPVEEENHYEQFQGFKRNDGAWI